MSAATTQPQLVPLWFVLQFGLIGPAPGTAWAQQTFKAGKNTGRLPFVVLHRGRLAVDLARLADWVKVRVAPVWIDWAQLQWAAAASVDQLTLTAAKRARP